jgi:DNA repair protein SbcD/Mre11
MKNPLFAIITDLHISDDNYNEVKKVVVQAIHKTVDLGLSVLYVAGDIFNSRKNQTLNVLQTWLETLDYCQFHGITLRVIPGNHDKLDYTSQDSYLDIFASHSNMHLVTSHESFTCGRRTRGFTIHMVPFFDEESTYMTHFNSLQIDPSRRNVLITHIAVNGVKNNDGSEVDEGAKPEILAPFEKVFVGHYHNKQKIGSKTYYIGSIMPKNYGEDNEKGMTIVYTDGSHELFQLEFKKFVTVNINLDTVTDDLLKKTIEANSFLDDNIRVKFSGKKETLDAFDKTAFADAGFDIKYDYKIQVDVSYKQAEEFSGFDKQKIKDEWDEFAQNNEDIDSKIGKDYLEQVL